MRLRRVVPEWVRKLSEVLTEAEIGQLATYNAEVGRGIMHTSEWREKIAELQHRYDEALRG